MGKVSERTVPNSPDGDARQEQGEAEKGMRMQHRACKIEYLFSKASMLTLVLLAALLVMGGLHSSRALAVEAGRAAGVGLAAGDGAAAGSADAGPASAAVSVTEKMNSTQIPVSMSAKGLDETFTVVIQGDYSPAAEVEQTEIHLKDGEQGAFHVTVAVPGTYLYTVSERTGTGKNTVYDARVYHVKVYGMLDDNGSLYAETVAFTENEQGKLPEVSFSNRPLNPQTETPSTNPYVVPGHKTTSGGTTSGRTTSGEGTNPVKTGDESPVEGWILIMALALIAATIAGWKRAGREEK